MIPLNKIIALNKIDDMGKRLEMAAWACDGNIVEIGGGEGINTLKFLRIAREKKTTVIVVDPFEQVPGADNSYFAPYSFEQFDRTMRENASDYLLDHLCLIRLPSQDTDICQRLAKHRPIGFMFIDGLQDKESVLSDLKLAERLGAELICVDDYDRLTPSSQVPLAVEEFRNRGTGYGFIDIGKREAYLIKLDFDIQAE